MKKQLLRTMGLIFTLVCVLPTHGQMLYFKESKVGGWSLRKDFLQTLANLFHNDVFVESGTSYGSTLKEAKNIFDQVYSIELDQALYERALNIYAHDTRVHLLHGDSGQVMPNILASLHGRKIMFWLDGHYAGDTTKRAANNTPLMDELRAIKESGITDSVIIIDDICCCQQHVKNVPEVAQGYPTLHAVKEAILKINAAYEFLVYGDMVIAYPKTYAVEPSPLVRAMTTSALFDPKKMKYQEVFEAEAVIATQTTAAEVEALWDQCTYHFGWHRAYPYLWYSLALFTQKRYAEAYDNFLTVIDAGYTDWRVYWYGTQAAFKSGKNAGNLVAQMSKATNDLRPASVFMLKVR